MDMVPHINRSVKGIYYQLRRISRIRPNLDKRTCITVVHALVTSRIDYHNGLLANLPKAKIRPLELAQHNAACMIMGVRKYDHVSPILRSLHWLHVDKRIVYKLLLTVYKVIHGISQPQYLTNFLTIHQPARALRSGDMPLQLVKPKVNKCVGERAFAYAGPHLWNMLPVSLRTIPKLVQFKKALKTHLF